MGLRLRFGVAAVLLVGTTVIASVWTLAALSRLSGLVTDTVRDSEAVTAVTSKLSGALEREDDAVLLVLAGDQRGTSVLAQRAHSRRQGRRRSVRRARTGRRAGTGQTARVGAAGVPASGRRGGGGRARTRSSRAVSPAGQSAAASRGRPHDRDSRSTFRIGAASRDGCEGRGQRVAAGRIADYARRSRLCRAGGVALDEPGRGSAAASHARCQRDPRRALRGADRARRRETSSASWHRRSIKWRRTWRNFAAQISAKCCRQRTRSRRRSRRCRTPSSSSMRAVGSCR